MKDKQFIDGENKIIVDCPECGNQKTVYLIRLNKPIEGFETWRCEACGTICVLDVEIELVCKTELYKCGKPSYKTVDPGEIGPYEKVS